MPIAATMPAITHVAVTVTDLAVSVPWYSEVLGVDPFSTRTPARSATSSTLGTTLFGLHGFPDLATSTSSTSAGPGSTTSPSAAPAATSW